MSEREEELAGVLAHHADDLADWLLATTHALLPALEPGGGSLDPLIHPSKQYPSSSSSSSSSLLLKCPSPGGAPPVGGIALIDHRLNRIVLSEVALLQSLPPSSMPTITNTATTTHNNNNSIHDLHTTTLSSGPWTVCQVILDLVLAVWTVLTGLHDIDTHHSDGPSHSSSSTMGGRAIFGTLSSWEHREERVASATLDKYLRLHTMLTKALATTSAAASTFNAASSATAAASGVDLFGDDDDEEEEEFEI